MDTTKSQNPILRVLLYPILLLLMIFISYISLFYNDASANLHFITNVLGKNGVYVFDALLLLIVVPIALKIMDVVTGEFGLERFKRLAAISAGMTALGFAAVQFIGAIATSSAEGATVIVEIVQQMAHFSGTGELEQYGLVGMLTSDASGPWNSSIFPMIILIVWFLKRKYANMETKQLHVPMFMQWLLYGQQFFFGLDLKYTLLEIILMGITGTIFVWGMLSFLIPMFKNAEKAEAEANGDMPEPTKKKGKNNPYSKIITWVARACFNIITFNPWNKDIDSVDRKIMEKRGGFGGVNRNYVVLNAVQITVAMTVAMFALVMATQFLAVQIKMSDAEAALFGTAGLTSAPEAFVAFAAGPYINALLLVGSNIIDGWMSAIGQTILLTYAEIASHGEITFIPLHPAIRLLTFLSWTQGMMIWAFLGLYAHNIVKTNKKSLLTIFTISGLALSIVYYFGGAWFSAQALGYGADYAVNSFVFRSLNWIANTLANSPAQQITLVLNILGLGALVFWWSGIHEKIGSIIGKDDLSTDSVTQKLKTQINEHLIREDQQVVIVIDQSEEMDKTDKLFANKWLDLVFKQTVALGFILDDDEHIPVYITKDDSVHHPQKLLTRRNADHYIEKVVGRHTNGKVQYAPVLREIHQHYHGHLTEAHDPVLILFITTGSGQDIAETKKALTKMKDSPVFTQFLCVYGEKQHPNLDKLQKLSDDPNNGLYNTGVSALPLFSLTDVGNVVGKILNEYALYLKKATKNKIIKD
ncbi:MAG: VWA domain-containing protein [Candidatus Pacebacteria bacterium]|nr:VWA domain-containing protein [Candidatus Paceibacterota bacterium]